MVHPACVHSYAATTSGLAWPNGESDEGGLEELVESIPNRRFNSAFSARNSSIARACSTTRAASSSYDGRPPGCCTT